MFNLSTIPAPKIIEELSFDDLKKQTIELFKIKYPDYNLLESDPYMANIEANAYRELLTRARINESIKAILLPYAKGSDLDNLAALYGINRLSGAYPRANIKLTLSIYQSVDITIPFDTIFRSANGDIAKLKESVNIVAGELSSTGIIEFQQYTLESNVKCEFIQTPLPYVLKAEQLTNFSGGSNQESDESFIKRIVLSLGRFSTAGSKEAYRYYALSASVKVEEAIALNAGAGCVKVVLKTKEDEDISDEVLSLLSSEKVRPLTDSVEVVLAKKININIKAVIELVNLSLQGEIDLMIKNGKIRFGLGEDLNLSYIYSRLHQNGVYRVTLVSPSIDIKANEDEFIEIENFELEYKEFQA